MIIGAGALVGTGLVVFLITNKSACNKQCFLEIDQLGPVKKDGNGLMSFSYYKDIFMIISKHA